MDDPERVQEKVARYEHEACVALWTLTSDTDLVLIGTSQSCLGPTGRTFVLNQRHKSRATIMSMYNSGGTPEDVVSSRKSYTESPSVTVVDRHAETVFLGEGRRVVYKLQTAILPIVA